MRITTLLENTTCRPDVVNAHGLSQYVETKTHKLLFDMGPSPDFWKNAEALGVDLTQVDVAVLSHGHNDHSGGLEYFCRHNDHAPIYLEKDALGPYYAIGPKGPRFIGVDPACREFESRFRFCSGETVIDGQLRLFSDVVGTACYSHANDTLRRREEEEYLAEDFRHEHDLLVTEGETAVLLAGCAHRGIVNILRRAEAVLGRAPDAVLAGFHLYNPGTGQPEPRELVEAVGRELAARKNTVYYTGHCTGEDAFSILKELLGDRLHHMSGGCTVEL